jgi:hypothetical protein
VPQIPNSNNIVDDRTNKRAVHIILEECNPTQSHTNSNQKYHNTKLHPINSKLHAICNTLQSASFPYPYMNRMQLNSNLKAPNATRMATHSNWTPPHTNCCCTSRKLDYNRCEPKGTMCKLESNQHKLESTPYQPNNTTY